MLTGRKKGQKKTDCLFSSLSKTKTIKRIGKKFIHYEKYICKYTINIRQNASFKNKQLSYALIIGQKIFLKPAIISLVLIFSELNAIS